MTNLENMLHNWNETNQKINNKIVNILPTITAASTASAIDRKSVVFSGTGKALESLKVGGRTVQNGTPTPDAPIEVKGVGDEANLFNIDDVIRDDTYYLNDDGVETNDGNSGHIKNFIKIKPNNTCTIMSTSTATFRVYFYDVNKQWLGRSSSNSAKYVFKRSDVYYIQIQYLIASSTLFLRGLEIYNGKYKIPISCNGEITNIYLDSPVFDGETVDFTKGIVNRKYKVIDANNVDWTKNAGSHYWKCVDSDIAIPQSASTKPDAYSNKYVAMDDSSVTASKPQFVITANGLFVSDLGSSIDMPEDCYFICLRKTPIVESFDISPIPTIFDNNELVINTEVTPTSIDVTSFGDYYSKAEVDKMVSEVKQVDNKWITTDVTIRDTLTDMFFESGYSTTLYYNAFSKRVVIDFIGTLKADLDGLVGSISVGNIANEYIPNAGVRTYISSVDKNWTVMFMKNNKNAAVTLGVTKSSTELVPFGTEIAARLEWQLF